MAIINNNIVEITAVHAITSPMNRVIILKDTEVTIRVTEITSPDTTEAVSMWESNNW